MAEANRIEFVDIVSKPVGITYERVQTLGIYCWQYEKNERAAAYFMPRLSFNSNKDYIKSLYTSLDENKLQGKGIYTSIWRIKKFYNKVSITEPEKVLASDFQALSAFKAWVQTFDELRNKRDSDNEDFLQMYVLENEMRFAKYKYTKTQNPSGTVNYNWSQILEKQEIE